MKSARIRALIKPWMMPIAIICGILFHNIIEVLSFLAPYLICAMLFVTSCKIRPSEIKFDKMQLWLGAVQILGGIGVYLALLPFGHQLAEAVFICVFCPTATAAPVITSMLGGNPAKVISFSLLSNLAVAVLAPVLFQWMSPEIVSGHTPTFFEGLAAIGMKVVPLLLIPIISAFILMKVSPRLHDVVANNQAISFYLWVLSLLIVMGRAVNFVLCEPPEAIPMMIAMGVLTGIVCAALFIIGRHIGRHNGFKVEAAQSLAQKNTVLAIWMALTYLSPISSVGPAAYIIWQNTINSFQVYLKTKKEVADS